MADPKKDVEILEDIEKQSEYLMSSNEDLASRLRQNQATLETINIELESLRKGEGFDPALKARLESLKKDLEEKRDLIADLIDSVKPLEVDMSRSANIVTALKQRIDDQGAKIESLSRDVLEQKKSMQQLTDTNLIMKEKLVEKESTIHILKERMKEKTDLLRTVDEKNRNMEQEVDAAKKRVFAMENKLGAVEKSAYAGDERNQQLMYELMKTKDRLKQMETVLAQRDQLLAEKDGEFAKAVEKLQMDAEERRKMIMEAHSKKVAVMNAQIASLRSALDQYKKLAESRKKKEQALMSEFRERMNSLMSSTVAITEAPVPPMTGFSETVEGMPAEASLTGTEDVGDFIPPASAAGEESNNESRIDEILPMVEMAMEHGDSADDITNSLLSSGYSEKEIHEALNQLQVNQ